ncbi:MAG TPA: DUF1634 domain-containing protein [Bryobacteraceae bacterium]|jgi:uncharacterized membrane protein|nr:DUF1634 domain-containing protein [Bryobacteraceae bacterium]
MAAEKKMTDVQIELMVSVLLRAGVLISAAVVFVGGTLFLLGHGSETINVSKFVGQPSIDRRIPEILEGALSGRARSIIQLGILLLILTPVARVVLSIIGFAAEKDSKYVVVTVIVLAVLLYSLIGGAVS